VADKALAAAFWLSELSKLSTKKLNNAFPLGRKSAATEPKALQIDSSVLYCVLK